MQVHVKLGHRHCQRAVPTGRRVSALHKPASGPTSAQREQLLQQIRQSKGSERQRLWRPELEPPAALKGLSVVLVGPRKPQNVGAVARLCNCFECEDLRVVQSSCKVTARPSLNAAMGAQRLLWQASQHDALGDAIADCAYSIAFGRWTEGSLAKDQRNFRSASSIAAHLRQKGLLGSPGLSEDMAQQRVAFVFGREVEGLMPEEVAACSAACQLPMGRLQESLSLTHAIAIAMSAAFEGAMAANGRKE